MACFFSRHPDIAVLWLFRYGPGNHGPALRDQAYGVLGENPKQVVKIGEHLLKTADSEADSADANFLIAQSYRAQGNCNQALVYGFRAKEQSQSCGLIGQQIEIRRATWSRPLKS